MQICGAVKGLDEPFSLYTRSSEEILTERKLLPTYHIGDEEDN